MEIKFILLPYRVHLKLHIPHTRTSCNVWVLNTLKVSPFVITGVWQCFFIQQIETDIKTEEHYGTPKLSKLTCLHISYGNIYELLCGWLIAVT